MKMREHAGAYLSALGGKFLAEKRAREDAGRNRRRLEDAALVSRELGAQRIADEEIKKMAVHLVYEADRYIAAALKSEAAFYEPLVLDALDNARAAVNAWKKNENEAAAGKYLSMDGKREGIVIPREYLPREYLPRECLPREDGSGYSAGNGEIRESTLGVLRESLRVFTVQNSIRTAGDPDAALAALAGEDHPQT